MQQHVTKGKNVNDNPNDTQPDKNIDEAENAQTPEPQTEVQADTVAPQDSQDSAETVEPAESESTSQNDAEYTEPDTTYQTPMASPTAVPHVGTPNKSKKPLIIAVAAAVVLVVIGLGAWWLMSSSDTTDPVDSSNVSTEPAKLGVAVTVADGTVEYSRDDSWQKLAADSDVQLAEGDQIRTGADSRAVLTLDDGSALRLDAKSQVELVSLAADDVRINHVEGAVYSRVVPSERTYTVAVDDVSYEALGTAFVTIKRDTASGLQVFQSSVKASGLEEAVVEGKQYFVANANSALKGKVTGINLATLVSNKFVAWNVAEDKKDAKFKQNLGVLAAYDKVVADEKAKQKAEAEAKAAAEKARLEAAEKARLEAERKAREAANQPSTAVMTAKYTDGGIFWTYAKTAEYGFKVVYSATNTTPSFQQSGTDAVYVSEPRAQFLGLPKEMKAGKTYYVRVCAYEPNNPAGPCQDYSNVLQVKRT